MQIESINSGVLNDSHLESLGHRQRSKSEGEAFADIPDKKEVTKGLALDFHF